MCTLLARGQFKSTFRRLEHNSDDTTKHGNSQQTDLLVFADFTEVGDADGEVSERAVSHDRGEVLLVQSSDDLKSRARDAF